MKKLLLGFSLLLLSVNAFSRINPEDEKLKCMTIDGSAEVFSLYSAGDGYKFVADKHVSDEFRKLVIGKFDLFKGEISETKIDLSYYSFGTAKASIVGEKGPSHPAFYNVSFTFKYNARFSQRHVPELESLEDVKLDCTLVN